MVFLWGSFKRYNNFQSNPTTRMYWLHISRFSPIYLPAVLLAASGQFPAMQTNDLSWHLEIYILVQV